MIAAQIWWHRFAVRDLRERRIILQATDVVDDRGASRDGLARNKVRMPLDLNDGLLAGDLNATEPNITFNDATNIATEEETLISGYPRQLDVRQFGEINDRANDGLIAEAADWLKEALEATLEARDRLDIDRLRR